MVAHYELNGPDCKFRRRFYAKRKQTIMRSLKGTDLDGFNSDHIEVRVGHQSKAGPLC